MNDSNPSSPIARPRRLAWNKGKLTGAKPPLRPGHVWSIRAKLQLERRTRDLTLFNLAIDSKLRGCDLVALRVDDNGYAVDRANIRQRKTGRPVRFELTEVTRQALDDYLRMTGRKSGQYLFPGRRGPDRPLTARQNARFVSEWVRRIGLDPLKFAMHSMRRTKVTLETSARLNSFSRTRASRAPSVTSVSKSTMRWKSPRKSTSEIPGQS